MSTDPGLVMLKKNGLICPFSTTPEQYAITNRPEMRAFCWFKAENAMPNKGRLEPLLVECPFTADFESCPVYQTNIPPL